MEVEVDADMVEEKLGEEAEEEQEDELAEEEEEEERTALIKSNNPHLAGGEINTHTHIYIYNII